MSLTAIEVATESGQPRRGAQDPGNPSRSARVDRVPPEARWALGPRGDDRVGSHPPKGPGNSPHLDHELRELLGKKSLGAVDQS